MTHGSLFSGIGGFDLAAEWMGWENLFHCEWNPFCQKVLKYHWPHATQYHDICSTDFRVWNGKLDILTGGFPCQPFSIAGKRAGTADDRYLWPEMLRAIREIAPRFVVGENVDGIFTWNDGMVFETVCADLENEGYEVATYRIPACATGAPHRRDRWWFVGHAKHDGRSTAKNAKGSGKGSNGNKARAHQFQQPTGPALSWDVAANPDNQRQPQPGGPLREERGRAGDEAGHDSNTTGEGLEDRQQARRQSPPAQNGAGMERGTTNIGFHATHPRRSHAQNGLHGQQPGGQASEHRDGIAGGDRWQEHWIAAATRLCVLDDGLPGRLDAAALSTRPQHAAGRWRKESLKAAGNAIVPQVAHAIFQAIEATINP